MIRCSIQQQNKPTSFEGGTIKFGIIKKRSDKHYQQHQRQFYAMQYCNFQRKRESYAMRLAKIGRIHKK
jgi:hypothetical protein